MSERADHLDGERHEDSGLVENVFPDQIEEYVAERANVKYIECI